MAGGVLPGADALPVPKSISMRPSALKQLDRRRLRNARRAESWRARLRPLPPLPLAPGLVAPPHLRTPPPSVPSRGFRMCSKAPLHFQPEQHTWTDDVHDESANPDHPEPLRLHATEAQHRAVEAAAPSPRVRTKRAARFDAFFADWKRLHPEWESHQDALAVAAIHESEKHLQYDDSGGYFSSRCKLCEQQWHRVDQQIRQSQAQQRRKKPPQRSAPVHVQIPARMTPMTTREPADHLPGMDAGGTPLLRLPDWMRADLDPALLEEITTTYRHSLR